MSGVNSHLNRQQNLKVNQQYIQWLMATNRAIMGHLYQWQSIGGLDDYFTDLDIDIDYSNQVWKSSALRFEGLQRKIGIGVAVDEQNLKVWASPTDTLFGSAFLEGAQQGLLDGALVIRFRAVWRFVSGNVANDLQFAPLAVWPLFTGYVSGIGKGGSSHIELKVKSALLRLNVNMPRNYYQPGCGWTLYDQFCTVNKSLYVQTGVVGAGSSGKTIVVSGGVPSPTGADGLANYAQGRLLFTSGVNNGLLTLMDTNDSASITLAYLLDDAPSPGDTITFYPGCAKTYNTCNLKFNNANNFRGFDKVPPVMLST